MRKFILLVAVILLSNQSLFSQVPSYVPSNGLVGFWPFSGNANDTSGNGNNGTVNGASLTTDRNGVANSAYSFNGSTSYIDCGTNSSLRIIGNISISAWFLMDGGSLNPRIVNYGNGTVGGYTVFVDGNSNVSRIINATNFNAGGSGTGFCCNNPQNFNVSSLVWHHIVYTSDSSGLAKIYIDGVQISSYQGMPVNNINYTGSFNIGRLNFPSYDTWGGKLDDIGIWNRALTPQEVTALYTSCTTPAPTGALTQTFCATPAPTIASLTATGTGIQWYAAATGGTALATTTALVNGTTYYASQTVSACESTARLAVTVTFSDPQITASATTICNGTQVTLTATSGVTSNFYVGSIGPSGGYVFYDQGSVINGWRYLEAAPSDNGINDGIGCYCSAIPNTSTLIGTGKTNTLNWINSGCNGAWLTTSSSIQINGNNNWFIPSKDEVNLMYTNLKLNNLGNFQNVQYWSSSPASYGSCGINGGVWVQNFTNGNFVSEARNGYGGAGNLRLVRQFSTGTPFATYLWSTGATTATINPTPTATTTYWCDVTVNGVTCRKSVTITVNSTPTPTGAASQTFCATPVPTVASLTSTGTGIQWYAAASGGTALATTTALVNGTTYYASQTLNACESTTRLAVTVILNDPQITASATTVCSGTPVTLSASTTATAVQNGNLPINLQTGLVGYWPFNGNANDVSGNANNGTVQNGTLLSNNRFNIVDTAYDFDGVNDQIEVNNNSSISPSQLLSINLWLFPRAYEDNKHCVSKGSHVNLSNRSYGIQGPENNQKARFFISNGTNEQGISTQTSIPLNQWTLITGVYDGATIKIYVNGSLDNQISFSGSINNTSEPLIFGSHKYYSPSDYWFNGKLDDIAIYNRVLSPTEITQLYTAAPTYLWSTGETTATINPTPTATTTYWCDVTVNGVTCRKTMTITVNPNITPAFTQVAAICNGAILAALPTTSTNSITGTWSPALNNTATTTYTFTPTAGQCATTATMTITVNPNITPAFTQVAAICNGATLAALPTTSTNSITGTWSPALNNTATTTYTFTPTAGQCATTATMTITVNTTATPTGTATQTFCATPAPTVASLTATGTGVQWYAAANGGTALATTTALVNGTTYYATQTLNACESTTRLAVTVTLNDPQITASATTVCSGTPVTLSASTTATIAQNCNLPANLQTGLVGYWPFCGNANDVSGNANNGTVNGATLTTDRFGNANSAYSFDGNDVITTNINRGTMGNYMSISCFYKFQNNSVNNYEAIIGGNDSNGTEIFIGKDWENPLNIGVQDGNYNGNFVTGSNAFDGNWHHIIYTYENNIGKIYLDGQLSSTGNFTKCNDAEKYNFGNEYELSGYFFNGKIDDIGFWNRVLTQSEITQLYNSNQATYLWSTGETTATINPSPTSTTTYWCDVTVNGVTCRKTMTITVNPNITPAFTQVAAICNGATLAALPTTSNDGVTGTWSPALNNTATTTYTFTPTVGQCAATATMTITVNTTPTPTGTATQTFCATPAPTVASLTATGTGVQWYAAANGGTALATTTALVNGTTYYASQTLSACESNTRLAVTVILNDPQITASATTVCSGTPVTLSASTTATAAQNGNLPINLQTGLVGYWPFNGNANDVSGNANNGTVNGATLTTDRFGNANSAYDFDGQSYIRVPHTNMLNFGIGDYSLSVWANKSGNNWLHNLIAKATPHPATGWQLGFVYSDLRFLAGVQNSISLSNGGVSYGPIINGEWNNYIAVFNPTMNSIKIYKNGQIEVSTIVSSSLINCDNIYDLMFGVSNPNGAPSGPEFFQGKIDNIGIWNRALSQSEITQLYTAAPTYLWSTGETTATINPTPTATTTYWCDVTVNGVTCRKTMTITVNPNITPAFTQVAPICNGATLAALPTTSTNSITGTWSPAINNTATTTYTFTPTAGQCATTATMTITVNPNITPAFTQVAAICNGATLAALPTTSTNNISGTWSPAINNTATTTYTFTPTAGQCATIATMTITVNPNITPAFTQVAPICNGSTLAALPTTSTNSITGTWSPALNNTATTTYTFTPTAGLCATTATMTITVNPNITPAFSQVPAICNGATLAALPTTSFNNITGTWSPALNNTATTTYTFTPTVGLCATTATMTITVNPIITPTFTQVAAICSGADLLPLPTSSTNGINGTWSPAMNNTATTTYTFTPIARQCATTATMTITVNPNITPTFTQVAAICAGATLAALPTTSNNGYTGTWSPAMNNTATTTYTFTPTAGLCATTATMTITVNPLPLPPTGTITQTFCANIYPTLQNIVVTPANVNWFSSLTSSTPLPITTNLPVGSTTYYASQFDAVTGCSSNGRLAVLATVLLENTPSTLTDQTFCSTDLKTLADIKTNGLNIVWYSSASGGTPLLGSYVLTSSQSLYAAIYNATTGCESPIRQMVQITIINCQLVANNLLTLNDNSLNDNLKIENIENFPINQIEIYNRFGEIVWKTEYYNNDSNTFKGRANVSGVYQKDSDLPTGTYYFLLKYYDSYRGKYTDLKSFLYINNNN